MSKRIITDEELRAAAREVLEYELAIFDSYHDLPDHHFRGEFRLNMAVLLHDVKRGAVKAATYSMGFTFYAKRCIAAVLLVFTLSCIAMPEVVLAGYHKLIEVIETVFEEYTEYRYRVNDDGGIEENFKPLKLGYLPEGMEEVWREEHENSIDLFFKNESEKYFKVYQCAISMENSSTFRADTEIASIKEIFINGRKVELIYKKDRIQFVSKHINYYVSGQTNLTEIELIKIVEKMN